MKSILLIFGFLTVTATTINVTAKKEDKLVTEDKEFEQFMAEFNNTMTKNKAVQVKADQAKEAIVTSTVSKFAEIKQEIEACQDRLNEIANASKNATKLWVYGNHDVRLFNYIATHADALMEFSDLFSYFPGWHTGWRVDINNSVIVKHRWANGVHASYNNTLRSGRSIVTGHLHQLKVTPWSDYNGRRWGVDSGTLAEPYGDQFAYTEENPVNWCSGFAVLTFKNGMLLPPELCEVINGVAYFRGEKVG